jgi:hypothetical protein
VAWINPYSVHIIYNFSKTSADIKSINFIYRNYHPRVKAAAINVFLEALSGQKVDNKHKKIMKIDLTFNVPPGTIIFSNWTDSTNHQTKQFGDPSCGFDLIAV